MGDRALDEELPEDLLVGSQPVLPFEVHPHALAHLRPREALDETADDPEPGVAFQHFHLPLQALREGVVVGIHAGDTGSAAVPQAGVEGGDQAGAAQGHGADARVAGSSLPQDAAAAVPGAVVDGDDLEIAQGLPADAPQGFGKGLLGVVYRQQDGNPGQGHGWFSGHGRPGIRGPGRLLPVRLGREGDESGRPGSSGKSQG